MNRSTLRPETLTVLAASHVREPLFSNQILAELFASKYSRGPLKLLPFAEGGYIVFDEREPLGRGLIERCLSLELAAAALEIHAAKQGAP